MNIKDVATLAATSVATVSRVINGDLRVAEATRKRVMDVVASTGYRPRQVDRSQRSTRRGTILVLLPDISNPYFSTVVEGIDRRAAASEYNTMSCVSYRDREIERRHLNLVKSNWVDGVILFTSTLGIDELEQYATKHPVVQCDAGAENIAHISFTCIDNIAAADEAVSYLLGLGHKRIGLINGAHGRPYEGHRQEGYVKALERAGISVDKRLIATSDFTCAAASTACAELMNRANPPTAVFCISDIMAAGAIKYLVDNGLTPGRDVDVVGFDGTYLSDITTPSITCVEQPGQEIGKTAFDLLLELITDPTGMRKKVIMPHKFVIKQSTREK